MKKYKMNYYDIIDSLEQRLKDCQCYETLTGMMRCSNCQNIDNAINVLKDCFATKEPESDKEYFKSIDTSEDGQCIVKGYKKDGIIHVTDCKYSPKPTKIEPLNLIDTRTSRNELRDTEKEIMIENKINEIINVINHLNK